MNESICRQMHQKSRTLAHRKQYGAVESMCSSALLLVGGKSTAQRSTAKVLGEYFRDLTRITRLPLGDRADRSGSGELRFASISLERAGGIPVSAFQCGADAVLHFVAENRTSRELRRLEMSLGIDNEAGQRVALADTTHVNAHIPELSPGPKSIRVVIPGLGLIPGSLPADDIRRCRR
jgi:lipopolysaccharide transport system ATP-binding protein